MKRIFCLLLAACMMLSLCACGKGREKDAGNDTLSSNEEASASAESIPTPKEQETPGESEPSQPYAGKVDVDLTVLSSTMVYSEVYNMLYNDPAHYLGKTVKARGEFSIYQLVTDGVLQPDPVSYACIISDAAACCAEGMEFVLEGDLTYPDDYPELGAEITNVVVGRVTEMVRHPNSDHMWVCQIDVGEGETVQICTGAWNVHVGDLVPVAKHKSTLPGGVKITKGKLRGEVSCGMLCGLSELGLDERDFPYAAISAAAILGDYHPIDPAKPSIPADIQPGHKIFGKVIAARLTGVETVSYGAFAVTADTGSGEVSLTTELRNLHVGDMVALNTANNAICTLNDLHAEQKEFPNCIPDGIFILNEEGIAPGDDIKPIIGMDDHVVEFEITPNRPDCLSVIGLAREASATFRQPLNLHTPVVEGSGGSIMEEIARNQKMDMQLLRYDKDGCLMLV